MQFLSSQFDNRVKFLALFLVWTLCLGLTTLSAQHSCNPLIGAPSSECKLIAQSQGDERIAVSRKQPNDKSKKPSPSPKNPSLEDKSTAGKPGDSIFSSKTDQTTASPKCDQNFIPSAFAGVGSGIAAGAGASALAGAGMISATVTIGGAIIAAPATAAVATGILVFLVVRSLIGGSC